MAESVSVYDYRDYKPFLVAVAKTKGERSGFKSGLARACGCNNAYISSVLGQQAHLSLEQAERTCTHLKFTRQEAHYFLLLVLRARAGTKSLQRYFEEQMEAVLEQKLSVQRRLGADEHIAKEHQTRYFSSWIYAAVHVALSVPRLNPSSEAIAKYLDLPLPTVKKTLDFLESCGLATRTKNGFAVGSKHIHLGRNSENILRHHSNWRTRILRSLEDEGELNLNYSSAVALSRQDSYKVREILLSALKNSSDVIMNSPEEEVFALAIDFVPLGRSMG